MNPRGALYFPDVAKKRPTKGKVIRARVRGITKTRIAEEDKVRPCAGVSSTTALVSITRRAMTRGNLTLPFPGERWRDRFLQTCSGGRDVIVDGEEFLIIREEEITRRTTIGGRVMLRESLQRGTRRSYYCRYFLLFDGRPLVGREDYTWRRGEMYAKPDADGEARRMNNPDDTGAGLLLWLAFEFPGTDPRRER